MTKALERRPRMNASVANALDFAGSQFLVDLFGRGHVGQSVVAGAGYGSDLVP